MILVLLKHCTIIGIKQEYEKDKGIQEDSGDTTLLQPSYYFVITLEVKQPLDQSL